MSDSEVIAQIYISVKKFEKRQIINTNEIFHINKAMAKLECVENKKAITDNAGEIKSMGWMK